MLPSRTVLIAAVIAVTVTGCGSGLSRTQSMSLPAASAQTSASATTMGLKNVDSPAGVDGSSFVDFAYDVTSVNDWRTYADHLVDFEVASERKVPAPDDTPAHGRDLVPRTVTIRVLGVPWSRTGAKTIDQRTLDIDAGGWLVEAGKADVPVRFSGGAWLMVGDRYLAPSMAPSWPIAPTSPGHPLPGRVEPCWRTTELSSGRASASNRLVIGVGSSARTPVRWRPR